MKFIMIKFSINFSKSKTKFCLRLHYNDDECYLYVNKTEICKCNANEHLKYLFHLIPVRCTSYTTRTEGNISLIKTKHNFFKNSFFHLLLLNRIT